MNISNYAYLDFQSNSAYLIELSMQIGLCFAGDGRAESVVSVLEILDDPLGNNLFPEPSDPEPVFLETHALLPRPEAQPFRIVAEINALPLVQGLEKALLLKIQKDLLFFPLFYLQVEPYLTGAGDADLPAEGIGAPDGEFLRVGVRVPLPLAQYCAPERT